MSLYWTPTPRKSSKIKFAVAGTALALVAAVGGTISVLPAGDRAQPAAISGSQQAAGSAEALAEPAATATRAQVLHGGSFQTATSGSPSAAAGQRSAVLEAFTAVRAASARHATVRHRGRHVWHHWLTPRQIARQMLGTFHWARWQFNPLNLLWSRESSWNVFASNPYSGAYGIPQAVPGGKMASAGPNWQTSARTQIRWGLRYIKGVYGSPWAAWQHELATGWY